GPMIPALAAAVTAASGVDVPEESLRAAIVPAYLRLTCRIVGEDGKLLAQSKDPVDLWKRFGPRAREAWKKPAPSPSLERKGLKTWDFGELVPFVAQLVSGTE